MINLRPVFLITGILLSVLSVTMLLPALVDFIAGNPDDIVFVISAAITAFFGLTLAISTRAGGVRLDVRQMFVMTTVLWVAIAIFGALPFSLSTLHLSVTDAIFESMSGFTTTGSTVVVGLDNLPPGLLLWRGITQWIGGLGIIVLSISVLPVIRVGGMQLFRAEGFETEGKVMPRAAEISTGVTVIYIGFTFVCLAAFYLAGMDGLEAAVHAMTTLATGGYSTSDQSIGHFDSVAIEVITITGMVAGGIPFVIYLKALRGQPGILISDDQIRTYIALLLLSTAAAAGWLWRVNGELPLTALRHASFAVVSTMTGTGFVSTDYMNWGAFPIGLIFFLTFVGGCAGSTACGIKVFRFQILYQATRSQIQRLWKPHTVIISHFNGRPIPEEIVASVLSFFFIFGTAFVLLTLGLNLVGLDFVTAISSSATALANVGPGLGPIVGPAGTFQSLPDAAKWLLIIGMLVGRLEVFTVAVLFSGGFWRR
jgi:trk system potassium uptake protein